MKLMDKLKNALFEEEYVEVEERPKQKSKAKAKESRRDKVKQKSDKPIAKKIAVSEKPLYQERQPVVEKMEKEEEIEEKEEVLEKPQSEFRFSVMAEDDFSVTQPFDILDDSIEEVAVTKKEEPSYHEKPLYQASKSEEYGDYANYNKKNYAGAYEKKQEHVGFKPSPIISPIYGVLDKNYTKEEVKEKRDVRISTFSRDDLDLDAIRRKAYGRLEDDIESVPNTDCSPEIEEVEENLLVDLSQEDTPTVNKVTVGDAEEYFEDLGLEYNKDYIDASKEKATGRRIKEEKEVKVQEVEEEEKEKTKQLDDNDNLFDLIDSMYNEE